MDKSKMIHNSNDCVIMAVPKIDRVPTDTLNIVCLFVEKK